MEILINIILSIFKVSLVLLIAMAVFFLEIGLFDWMIFDRLDEDDPGVTPLFYFTIIAMFVIAVVCGIKGMWWIWYDILNLGVV